MEAQHAESLSETPPPSLDMPRVQQDAEIEPTRL